VSGRVVVLGAGMIGSAVAADLARSGFAVTLVDARDEALASAAARTPSIATRVGDLSSPVEVTRAVTDADLVVGALPSALGLQTLRVVIEARKTYCDISFMPEHAWELDGFARERGVVAIVDGGVAPGLSNVLAGHAAAILDPCTRIDIFVGGLPVARHWPFDYKAGFAPLDVIEEYTRPARVVQDGRVIVKEALSEPEFLTFDGIGTLEAFNTDGLRSLAYTLDVPAMQEKTLRYPGHIALMRALRETGFFSKGWLDVDGPGGRQRVRPLDVTAALMFPKWTFEPGEADVTVLRVVAEGLRDGRPARLAWELVDRYDPATDTRAMSRTTAYAATSFVALLADGTMAKPGVHPPEVLAREAGLVDRYLAELAARGIAVRSCPDTSFRA
jgi:saccharopine dehydrogenase-like NADP-dependent oxidoreductase